MVIPHVCKSQTIILLRKVPLRFRFLRLLCIILQFKKKKKNQSYRTQHSREAMYFIEVASSVSQV